METPSKLIAKFSIRHQTNFGGSISIEAGAVYSQEGDNKDFTDSTPSGTMELAQSFQEKAKAPALFEPGNEFYIWFLKKVPATTSNIVVPAVVEVIRGYSGYKEIRLIFKSSIEELTQNISYPRGFIEMTVWEAIDGDPLPAASFFSPGENIYIVLTENKEDEPVYK